jgi:hypothetical protein
MSTIWRCIAKHHGDHRAKDFAAAFAQLIYRESLRYI